MADQTVGTVYVQVEPSGRGFGKKIEGDISPSIDNVGRKGSSSLLSTIGGAFGKIGKIGLGAIGTVAGGLTALAAKGGFDRALNIENAQAKLKGLGHSTADIKEIMNDALASVKGTAFGMGDAASVAATLSASGITSGKQLTSVLKTVADTAQISGRSMTDIGLIFSSVAARGKLQGDDMLQLMSSGIPVLQMLSKHLGVTSADVSTMVSKGKIDFQTFADAMQEGLGGAALSAGTTFTGAWNNVKAAMSRLGETVATPMLGGLRDLFNQAIPLIDGFANKAKPILEQVGNGLGSGLSKAIPTIQAIFTQLSQNQTLIDLGNAAKNLADSIVNLGRQIGQALAPQFDALRDKMPELGEMFASLLNTLSGLIDFVADNADWLVPLTEGILGFVIASKGISLAGKGIGQVVKSFDTLTGVFGKVTAGATGLAKAIDLTTELGGGMEAIKQFAGSLKLVASAQKAWSAATEAAKAVQIAFSAVMGTALGPWALALTAITAVVGALTWFFTQTDTGKQIWSDFTGFLTGAWQTISSVASTVWNGIGSTLTSIWTSIVSSASGIWNGLASFFTSLWSTVSSAFASGLSAISGFAANVVTVLGAIPVWLGQQVLNGINTLFSTLMGLLTGWADNSTGVVHGLLEGIIAYVSSAWSVISTIVSTWINAVRTIVVTVVDLLNGDWQGAWNTMSSFLAGIWNTISANAMAVWTSISGFLSNTLNGIQAVWTNIWNTVAAFLAPVWNTISSVVSSSISAVGNAISSTLGWISGVWNSVWNSISGFLSGIWNGMVGAVQGAVNSIGGVVGSIWGIVTGALSGAGSWLVGVGQNIVNGLIEGIRDGFGWLQNIVTSMGSNILDWAMTVLHIHSPSRLMRDQVGVMVSRGVAVGVDKGQRYVQDAVDDMAESIDLSGYSFALPDIDPPKISDTDLRKSFAATQATLSAQIQPAQTTNTSPFATIPHDELVSAFVEALEKTQMVRLYTPNEAARVMAPVMSREMAVNEYMGG